MKKFSIMGLFLSVFFSAICICSLFFLFDISSQPFFGVKLGFAIFNFAVIIALCSSCNQLIAAVSAPIFSGVATLAGIYTILQFVLFGIFFTLPVLNPFIILEMVLLFIFLAIALPLLKAGKTYHKKKA